MEVLNLDKYLRAQQSLAAQGTDFIDGPTFDIDNDRNIVTNSKFKNISFSKAQGGTAVLGGSGDGDGVLQIKDSSGNVIVQGDNNGMHYYNTGGTEKARMNSNGIEVYGESSFLFYDEPDGNVYGGMGFVGSASSGSGKDQIFLTAEGITRLKIEGTDGLQLEGGGADAYINISLENDITSISGNTTLSADGEFVVNGSGITLNADVDLNLNTNDSDITVDSGGDFVVDTAGDFILNGDVKTAIVPTTEGYKALYCTESPEVWFMDFAKVKGWINKTYEVDQLFKEVTVEPYVYIPTTDKSIVQVWGKRKGHSDKRFENKTEVEFQNNNDFWRTPQKSQNTRRAPH